MTVREGTDYDSSEIQINIQNIVKDLYPEVQFELLVDEFYKVDMLIPSLKVVIEVQGPYHLNGLGINNKKTTLKGKILKKLDFFYCELNTI